ncbi:MAG: ATP-binding cassette domain-containing protein [Chitinophagaceae bacterium]
MLLGLQNVTFEFGARVIVEDATWHIQPNERIGLIGYNGTGKSTLLKVFTGQYQPSSGTVEKSRDTTIGFLHQDLLTFDTDDSILQVALGAFENVLQIEKEIEAMGIELEKVQMKILLTDMLTNFMSWKYLADIIFIIKRKRYCRDLVLPMLICSEHTKNLAADGECGYFSQK